MDGVYSWGDWNFHSVYFLVYWDGWGGVLHNRYWYAEFGVLVCDIIFFLEGCIVRGILVVFLVVVFGPSSASNTFWECVLCMLYTWHYKLGDTVKDLTMSLWSVSIQAISPLALTVASIEPARPTAMLSKEKQGFTTHSASQQSHVKKNCRRKWTASWLYSHFYCWANFLLPLPEPVKVSKRHT